ncbi:MAG: helix-turn-helix domain-containing protein [Oscillospiraceae bacterium]|nr:helix-turn-helix domain-containing protein [Oscillospiraceae bacterium]
MILALDQICNYEITVSHIRFYYRQQPSYRRIDQKHRRVNGLIFPLQGQCRFTSAGGSFTLSPGAVAYVPSGSKHVFELLTEDTAFCRLDFRMELDGEQVLFSEGPLLLCAGAPTEFREAIRTMTEHNGFVQDSLMRKELVCTMLRSLSASFTGWDRERLAPAAEYLLEHLTEKINCAALAAMCNLSTSRFYSLFRQEYGKTPLAYRDELLMKRALLLLQSDHNVGETAEALGFVSAAYFSRFFKKNYGAAPSEYAAKQKGGI